MLSFLRQALYYNFKDEEICKCYDKSYNHLLLEMNKVKIQIRVPGIGGKRLRHTVVVTWVGVVRQL